MHVPRAHNTYVGALPILSSKIDVPNEIVNLKIMKRTLWVIVTDLFSHNLVDVQDWCSSLSKIWTNHLQLLCQRIWKTLCWSIMNFIIEVAYLLEPCPLLRLKKSCIESIGFHVTRLILTYIKTLRTRDITCLKWSRMLSNSKKLHSNVSNLLI